ncbi:hypothetical protein NM208_g6213 [Fusarium decemcellulare]|uniref:Uncharacterized protein n=1 Tax=Fusarium decemcellulare TaxID=57161 RepID=A0ACC1SEC2_9HYPO|nr:hypothetical protein NM208_g6213 [Fusarium decemcellulare]
MELNQFPTEILNHILSYLLKPRDIPEHPLNLNLVQRICDARLVCRRWNEIARAHLYQTLQLGGIEDLYLRQWNPQLSVEAARNAARHVIICTPPDYLLDEIDDASWVESIQGGDDPFISAIYRITELPNLTALTLDFYPNHWYATDNEGDLQRFLVLKDIRKIIFNAVLESMVIRATNPDNTTIRSLLISNMCEFPIPEITSSDLFKSATRNVESLHLMIKSTSAGLKRWFNLCTNEMRQFEPYLQLDLLPSLAHQLKTLTLSFSKHWGICSGSFDGRGLLLPRLETLTLGNYVIGGYKQFDWVLAHKTLRTLILDRCCIVSHLRTDDDNAERWGLRTEDWKKWPPFAFAFPTPPIETFTFAGTWEPVFDNIRYHLENLVDFYFNWDTRDPYFRRVGARRTELSPLRYIRFDFTECPGPWVDADEDGHFGFAEHTAKYRSDPPLSEEERLTLNPAETHKERDGRALDDLLRAVEDRAWRNRR